jgi:hypothetical protein
MNHTLKILNFLYQNNNGSFHDISKAYKKSKLPSDLFLATKLTELEDLKYIHARCFDEIKDLRTNERETKLLIISLNKPQSLQAMITTGGEDYVDKNTIRFLKWLIQKRNFIIYLIGY